MAKKVALGMSGGIDSSMAAVLLKEQGYEVTGFTLRLWDSGSRCSDKKEMVRARDFARFLGIRHYVLDLRKPFWKNIVDYFIREYREGRTPNPCVMCNRLIKFPFLFSRLEALGLDYLATGHYARIVKKGKEFFFAGARDRKKSQEYFLASVSRELLPRLLFPLEDILKEEVRALARKIPFPFRQDESQDVCFIRPGETCSDFLMKHTGGMDLSGDILGPEGSVLGRHSGFFRFTIGQRQGLGLGGQTPRYVLRIDGRSRSVIAGSREEAMRKKFFVRDLYWYAGKKEKSRTFDVKIRYNHPPSSARFMMRGRRGIVEFEKAQFAVTPGQFAVFYRGDLVAGSGWIEEVL